MENSIKTAVKMIRDVYADEQIGEKTAVAIEDYINSEVGKYRLTLDDTGVVIWDLNAILNFITHDLHFGFGSVSTFNPQRQLGIPKYTPHYAYIQRIESLEDEETRKTFTRVFSQFQDPIILDLRGCVGGDAEATYFILCHFFKTGTPMFEVHTRLNEPKTFYSADNVPFFEKYNTVTKYTGKIKVLVDSRTYSGGELIAKVLQNQGRAKIYGVNTAGMFNITKHMKIDNLIMYLPFGKIIDIKSKKDYDKAGVVPDFKPGDKEYIHTIFSELTNYTFTSFTK